MARERSTKAALPVLIAGLLLMFGMAACASAAPDVEATPIEPPSAQAISATVSSATLPITRAEPAPAEAAPAEEEAAQLAGWSEATHSDDADPNFAVVFPQDRVNQITFTVTAEVWAAMQDNMTALHGDPGTGAALPPGDLPQEMPFPGPPDFGGFSLEKPMWVTATVEFEGRTWRNVGLRYKGNSSLIGAWRSGSLKLPFKLDFDQFEDVYPEINDQRFYGFKQLSLANNFRDNAFMRDALTYDILEAAGLPAGETAFYQVILDYGAGPVNLGLYTLVEVVDDTLVERTFGGDDGNLYEGNGPAASFAEGTFDQIETSFEKENNEKEADWSDVKALYEVLHSGQRTTDPAAWRASLEAIFDVETFLEWLAISALIGHWDTYGAVPHNFYLYNNPATGQLTWISWDHNMTMGGVPDWTVTLDKANVTADWPLIRYLLDDPTYYAAYIAYLEETVASLYLPEEQAAKIATWAQLLAPYAGAEIGAEAYSAAVEQLAQFAYTSVEAAHTFLGEAQTAK